ncbi:MAG: 5-(carboxyamino)imidazole ribonucleotide synthase [Phycisphaerales bacterium]|nr:5-(carboxyamino)imidazole ribonucleotide synthase [Phycisphaerales bacterium]
MIVGVLGGGQLGRMLALAGYPLGLQFRIYDVVPEAPAEHVAEFLQGDFDDESRLEEFSRGLTVATYEFENVPVRAAEFVASRVTLHPAPRALAVCQDRLAEKTLAAQLVIPSAKFEAVESASDLAAAAARIGFPCMLKTRRLGYDGKGQAVLREPVEVAAAWQGIQAAPAIVEQFVAFEREVSLIAVRSASGECAFYPLVENMHRGGILRETRAPAPGLEPELQALAESHAARVLEELQYVGTLAIEFFERGGELLLNEMAPRVHNSGHWTIEGAATSQFENHIRAILGWPLGPTAAVGRSHMFNIIGAAPNTPALLAVPGAHVHLYGKSPRPGRKLGHVTLWNELDEHDRRIEAVRSLIANA